MNNPANQRTQLSIKIHTDAAKCRHEEVSHDNELLLIPLVSQGNIDQSCISAMKQPRAAMRRIPLTTPEALLTEIDRQKKYLAKLPADFGWPLFNSRVALESMRKSAYRTTAAAAREIVDNSIEAGATEIHIIIQEEKGSAAGTNLATSVAFIDNGSGMVPNMARYALTWGGGTHYDDPRLIGRFGFGLPNSSINQTRHVDVYTRTSPDDPITKAWLDLDDFAKSGLQVVPDTVTGQLPAFVRDYMDRTKLKFDHGTVVLWSKPDRLTYKRPARLKELMLDDFGVVYRYVLLRQDNPVNLVVQGVKVLPIDPLFLEESARYYEPPIADIEAPMGGGARKVNEWFLAVKYWEDPRTGELHLTKVKDATEINTSDKNTKAWGTVNVRVARFPFGFAPARGEAVAEDPIRKKRFDIRKNRRGISFVRACREIDTVDNFPKSTSDEAQGLGEWPLLQSYAYHWGMEVRFDPALDEVFGITHDKQSVRPHEDFWRVLVDSGVAYQVSRENEWQREIRAKLRKERGEEKTKRSSTEPSPAEAAAQDADVASSESVQVPEHAKDQARRRLEERAEVEAEATKQPVEKVLEAIAKEGLKRRYRIAFEDRPDGAFYEPEWEGAVIVVKINRLHPFHDMLYRGIIDLPGGTQAKEAVDVLLISLAKAELTAGTADMTEWYRAQRRKRWSPFLEDALSSLKQRLEALSGIGSEEESTHDAEPAVAG